MTNLINIVVDFAINNKGMIGLLFFFSLPLLYKFFQNLFSVKINATINKNEKFIILFYISSFVLFSSLFGSIFPTEKDLLKTINLVAYSAVILSIPTIIMTMALDRIIKKFSDFLSLEKGLLDPITNKKNIALRDETFFEILMAIEEKEISKIATKIGKEYTEVVLQQYTYITDFKQFIDKWEETDSKAGFFETINLDNNIVHINSSIAVEENIDQHKIHEFIQSYYSSIIKTFFLNVQGHPKDIELISGDTNAKLSFLIKDFY